MANIITWKQKQQGAVTVYNGYIGKVHFFFIGVSPNHDAARYYLNSTRFSTMTIRAKSVPLLQAAAEGKAAQLLKDMGVKLGSQTSYW